MIKFKEIWKILTDKDIMPFSDFETAFKADTEMFEDKRFFDNKIYIIPLNDIYISPNRPRQLGKEKRFSDAITRGLRLPPIKVRFSPPVKGDNTHFVILDGRGRMDTAIKLGYKKIAAVVTEVDIKTNKVYSGFEQYKQTL